MKAVFYLIALLPAVFATPVESQQDITQVAEGEMLLLAKRGFGCNGPWDHNEYTCNKHCKSNKFKGGYCNAATGWLRCDCYN